MAEFNQFNFWREGVIDLGDIGGLGEASYVDENFARILSEDCIDLALIEEICVGLEDEDIANIEKEFEFIHSTQVLGKLPLKMGNGAIRGGRRMAGRRAGIDMALEKFREVEPEVKKAMPMSLLKPRIKAMPMLLTTTMEKEIKIPNFMVGRLLTLKENFNLVKEIEDYYGVILQVKE